MLSPVLSHYQAKVLVSAFAEGLSGTLASLDLERSTSHVVLSENGAHLPDGQILNWGQIEEILDNELACYEIRENQLEKIHFFSPLFNRYYSLMPTASAPTMLISGIPMHRVKGTDPHRDTLAKVAAIAPIHGEVLDTSMGLGYTAIAAAESAGHVTTIEIDPTVEQICRRNPWSQDLFGNARITRLIGDSFERAPDFSDHSFTSIIHDPPMFNLAGELYSTAFYRQMLRILKPGGRMFHYIGNPASKSGRGVTRGAVRRLQEAGFRRVKPYSRAFGVVAYK